MIMYSYWLFTDGKVYVTVVFDDVVVTVVVAIVTLLMLLPLQLFLQWFHL